MTSHVDKQTGGVEGPASIDSVLASAAFSSPPKVALRLLKLCGGSPASAVEIAAVIETDAALATRLIRVANTIHYGAGIPVTNIQAATVRLGTDKIRSVALAFEIAATSSRVGRESFDVESHWQDCLIRGCMARAIAMNCDSKIAGEAFLVGLLQDMGVPVLAEHGGAVYASLVEQAAGCQLRLATLESQAFGFNHIHLVARMMQRWFMPAPLAGAIGRHHSRPPMQRQVDPSLRLWQIAYVVGLLPIGESRVSTFYDDCLSDGLSGAFGIARDGMADIVRQAQAEFQDIEEMFRPFIGRGVDAGALLAQALAILGVADDPHRASVGEETVRRDGRNHRSPAGRLRIDVPAIPLGAS